MSKTNIKLSPGQVWVTASGDEIWIQEILDDGMFVCLSRKPGSDRYSYRNWEQYLCTADEFNYHRGELKSVRPNPEIEFDPEFPHVAMDKGGRFYKHVDKPELDVRMWRDSYVKIPNALNWKETLVSCEPLETDRDRELRERIEALEIDLAAAKRELEGNG